MEGLVRALVIDGGDVRVDSIPLLVPRGYVLVKTLWARWGSIDEAIRRNLLPVEGPVVAGYTGVGVVIEAGIGSDTALAGKPVSPIMISKNYMPPIAGRGFASPYTVAPGTHLAVARRDTSYVFLLDAALACETLQILESRMAHSVLVVGAGTYGILSAYMLHDAGLEYTLFTRRNTSRALVRELGLATVQSVETLSPDALVVASLDAWLVGKTLEDTKPRVLVLHPLVAYRGVYLSPLGRGIEAIGVAGGREFAGCATRLAKKAWQVLSSHVSVIKGLVPPPRERLPALGVVYEISSS